MVEDGGSSAPWWAPAFRSVVDGRRVVIVAGSRSTGLGIAATLRPYGPSGLLVWSLSTGGPEPDGVELVETEVESRPFGELVRLWGGLVEDPPPAVVEAFDRFDPDGTAVVFRAVPIEPSAVLGRRVVSRRPASWVALEDKTVIDDVFDRHGVRHEPSVVVPVEEAPTVADDLDRGQGTVWAADSRDGPNGGGEGTRWVRTAADGPSTVAALAPFCDRVRVMPFIEGVPCSVHGIVMPDGVVALRPVEMVVLRDGPRFVYLGASTAWDPPTWVREQMRDTARVVGEMLRDEVAFRGAFTLDGVVGEDGFLPTEVNPRIGGGLQALTSADGAPPLLLFELVAAGVDVGVDAATVEAHLLDLADSTRSARLVIPVTPPVGAQGTRFLRRTDGDWSWCDEADADLRVDVSSIGTTAAVLPHALPRGGVLGPAAASLTAFLHREFGIDGPVLVAAPDLHA